MDVIELSQYCPAMDEQCRFAYNGKCIADKMSCAEALEITRAVESDLYE